MTRYCTLAEAKQEADTQKTSVTLADAYILEAINTVSQRVDALLNPTRKLRKRPFFAPYIEGRPIILQEQNINSVRGTLTLNMSILEITEVLAGTQDVTSQVVGYPPNFPPFEKLQLAATSCQTWYTLEDSSSSWHPLPNPLTVTGKWGWHEDWDNAFEATSLLAAGIDAVVTTFDVTATEGALFSPGHMLEVDDEYMEVTSVSTDTLTVTRGYNGSTKAAHLVGAVVGVLTIPEDIKHVVARQADKMYARRGAFEIATFDQAGSVQYPPDLLPELKNTVAGYAT